MTNIPIYSRTFAECDCSPWFRCNPYNLCFNSRTRTGCDVVIVAVVDAAFLFQFTHPHGVRLPALYNNPRHAMFQFTHPHGVRRYVPAALSVAVGVSIHAPARGATRLYQRSPLLFYVSIHAPARGATAGNKTPARTIPCKPSCANPASRKAIPDPNPRSKCLKSL